MIDTVWEGLTDPVCGQIMGRTAENLVEEFSIPRADQDAYAVESHRRAFRATREGVFKDEIAPVEVPKKAAGREVAPEIFAGLHLKMTGDTDFKEYFQANLLGKFDVPLIPLLFYFYPQGGIGFDFWDDTTSIFKAGAGFKLKLITLLAINVESNYSYMPSNFGKHAVDVFGGLMLDF